MLVVSKLSDFLNCSCGNRKTLENSTDVCTLLHRNNSELVLFVDPGQECLLSIVENASAFGPVTVQATGFEETVALFEQEMISD